MGDHHSSEPVDGVWSLKRRHWGAERGGEGERKREGEGSGYQLFKGLYISAVPSILRLLFSAAASCARLIVPDWMDRRGEGRELDRRGIIEWRRKSEIGKRREAPKPHQRATLKFSVSMLQ